VGPSHRAIVADQWGLSYDAPLRHTREYLEVLRPLLRGEAVEHRGERLTAVTGLEITGAPAPPPVLLSALGPRMLRLAGEPELADGTIVTWARPGLIADYVVPAMGPAGGRVAALTLVAVTGDPDAVREEVAQAFGGAGNHPSYRAVLERDGLTNVAETAAIGSEREVGEAVRRYREAGVTDLIVAPWGGPAGRRRVLDVLDALVREQPRRGRGCDRS
ncbi:LLM class flavin-dependent oxidoreductase, partial [Streptomyces boncukensis]